jgi:hypothetical protein
MNAKVAVSANPSNTTRIAFVGDVHDQWFEEDVAAVRSLGVGAPPYSKCMAPAASPSPQNGIRVTLSCDQVLTNFTV